MPAINEFRNSPRVIDSPALRLIAITPHLTDELSYVIRDIRVGATASDVTVVDTAGNEIVFSGVVAGEHLGPFFVKQVKVGPACGGGGPALCSGADLVLSAVNEARSTPRQCGSNSYSATPPLAMSAVLTQAAQRHAGDLAKTGATSHTGSDGSTVTDRAKAYGRPVGENVLTGDANLGHAMARLLESPDHCKNIMNPNAVKFGAACVETDRAVWVQVFGV